MCISQRASKDDAGDIKSTQHGCWNNLQDVNQQIVGLLLKEQSATPRTSDLTPQTKYITSHLRPQTQTSHQRRRREDQLKVNLMTPHGEEEKRRRGEEKRERPTSRSGSRRNVLQTSRSQLQWLHSNPHSETHCIPSTPTQRGRALYSVACTGTLCRSHTYTQWDVELKRFKQARYNPSFP